jgi:catechol 2,3-dioxygenase-like lactoylglutathione lyase family enzyme
MTNNLAHNPRSSRAQRGICFLAAVCALSAATTRSQSKRPPMREIDTVEFYSSDVNAADRFYTSIFSTQDTAENCRWGNTSSATGREARYHGFCSEQTLLLVAAGQSTPSTLLHEIVFATDNVNAMRKYLAATKIRVLDSSNREYFAVMDPEGHRIAFRQSRPSSNSSKGGPHIIHAGFVVRNRSAMEHFYKDILGFRPYWHGGMKDDQTDWVSLQVPDGTDWVEFMVNVPENADQRLRGIMNHIALGVPDIQAAREQLVKNGVHLTEEPKLGRDGKWQLNLYDPDQTRIEFMEFTPKDKPCCSEFTGPHPKP